VAPMAEEIFYRDLGSRIRRARLARRLTQQQLADALGLTRTSVANLEAGRQRVPAHTLAVAVTVLETTLSEVVPPYLVDDHVAGQDIAGLPRGVPEDHMQLLTRLVASADHGEESDATTETEHRRAGGREAS
jgi:transcriptional regulator with XRE-family HTH domain